MTTVLWIFVVWALCSLPASLLIGRALRDRDAHAPTMTVARHLAVVRDEERAL